MDKFWHVAIHHPLVHQRWVCSLAWGVAALLVVSLGWLHYRVDAEYAFSSLELLPIWGVAWVCGRKAGLALALLAALTWSVADLTSGRTFTALWIPIVNSISYVVLVLITTSQKKNLTQTEYMATRDGLTGLFNKSSFINFGMEEVERSKRYRRSMAVIFLDLDYFKILNDTQGHQVGDDALKSASDALVSVLRSTDITARVGGDEFAVILPEISYEYTAEIGHKILAAIRQAMHAFPPVSASVGVAWYALPTGNFGKMLKEADNLMYEIKKHNKSGVLARRCGSTETCPAE